MSAEILFENISVVPVVTIDNIDQARPLAAALCAAGIRAIEITLRSECALEAIAAVVKAQPDMLVGAGSIRRAEQIQMVADAGAKFCVSPGYTDELLNTASICNMPFIPGAATASEMLRLYEYAYSLIKFFPAEANGGVAMLKALTAPMPELRFFPTGGINEKNASTYLELESVTCVGGSWFVPGDCLKNRDFARIELLAGMAMESLG